nr:high light inducible protein [Synechococcus elongatus PCC 11801]QFZ93348.1 high light inducible protein [Synechococcus elongatus PCC 11802]
MVPKEELNAWKRGFTPQAEIWNGRFAMLGVTLVLATVLILNWGWLGF